MADWDFSGVESYTNRVNTPPGAPQTATATPDTLARTLSGLLPAPMDYLTHASTLSAPLPHFASEEELQTGRSAARIGLPIAGGMLGSSAGGIPGGTAGSMIGETLGQMAAGDPINPWKVGEAGAWGLAGGLVGRGLEVGGRALMGSKKVGGAVRGALGKPAAYATENADDVIQLPLLRAQVDKQLAGYNRVLGETGRASDTVSNKIVAELDAVDSMLTRVAQEGRAPLRDVNQIRKMLGNFKDSSPKVEEIDAVYAALMTDLRVAAANGSQAAETLLHDLANTAVFKAMRPQNWMEKLTGGAGLLSAMTLFGSGQPAWQSALPIVPQVGLAAYRGSRALAQSQLPRSWLEPVLTGLAQGGRGVAGRNPFLQR